VHWTISSALEPIVGAVGLVVSALTPCNSLERISTNPRLVGSVWLLPRGVVQTVMLFCHHVWGWSDVREGQKDLSYSLGRIYASRRHEKT
jgi:hypothetical protein